MPKEWTQKSPDKRKVLAAVAVFDLLPQDGSELGWTELRLKAEEKGMSSATLRAHLKRFQQMGIIIRRMDPSTYPPRVYYRRGLGDLLPEATITLIEARRQLDEIGDVISGGVPLEAALEVNRAAVKAHVGMIAAAVAAILYSSLGAKGPYEPNPEDCDKPDCIGEHLDRVRRDVHDLADEQLDILIKPWIHDLLDVTLILDSTSKDVLLELAEGLSKGAERDLDTLNKLLDPARETPREVKD